MSEIILPLEKQVCTLESSKILKDLGVPQRSLFYWADVSNVKGNPGHKWVILNGNCDKLENYSAYTVAEFGAILPQNTKYGRLEKTLLVGGIWAVYYAVGTPTFEFRDKNEVIACEKMLIYLLKNNLMEVPK